MKKTWLIVGGIAFLLLFGFIFFILLIAALLFSSSDVEVSGTGNVALIPVRGEIVSDEGFSIGGSAVSSTDLIELIKKADEDQSIDGIIFEINSPGGSAVASEEISAAIKKVHKPTAAWIREEGASGAYWIASSTNHIVASKMSIVGSIGVTSSDIQYGGLLNRYNMTYRRLVSGEYKDMGTPLREMTPEEKNKIQALLDKIHVQFIEEVSRNRNQSYSHIASIATGEVFLGQDAVNLGLIDKIGGKDEAVKFVEDQIGKKGDVVEYRKHKSFFDSISSTMNQNSFFLGKGIGSAFVQQQNQGFVIRT